MKAFTSRKLLSTQRGSQTGSHPKRARQKARSKNTSKDLRTRNTEHQEQRLNADKLAQRTTWAQQKHIRVGRQSQRCEMSNTK